MKKKPKFLLAPSSLYLGLVGLFVLASCAAQDRYYSLDLIPKPTEGTGALEPTDGFDCNHFVNYNQSTTILNKLDILLVIDTSGSMADELMQVAQQFNAFFKAVLSKEAMLDYRIGVMLAHGRSIYSGKFFQPTGCENPAIISGNQFSDFASEVQPFLQCKLDYNQIAREPAQDSEGEAGLISLHKSVTQSLDENKQKGFFREDAGLAVIFVSDENNICDLPSNLSEPQQYESIFRTEAECALSTPANVYNSLRQLKGNSPLLLGAIVNNQNKNDPQYGWGYLGLPTDLGYFGIIGLAGANGISAQISAAVDETYMNLHNIGMSASQILRKKTSFMIPSTVTTIVAVTVSTLKIPFIYIPEISEVKISPEDAGNENDEIQIQYCK